VMAGGELLTAEALHGLDLRGCEMASLSACQTALGDVNSSQGVMSLQRAFHAAGARSLVASLWRVHDAATLALMREMARRLWGKERLSKLEALRQAQLAILRDPSLVEKRAASLVAEARARGAGKDALRLPSAAAAPRSPPAWWAAFVLSGD